MTILNRQNKNNQSANATGTGCRNAVKKIIPININTRNVITIKNAAIE